MQPYCTVVFLRHFYINPALAILLLHGYCTRSRLNHQGVVTEETYKETKVLGLEKCQEEEEDPDLGSVWFYDDKQ